MTRARKGFLILLALLPIIVLLAAVLYRFGMATFENEERDFWTALEFAAETITTTGYGSDVHWEHPVMVLFVVGLQFMGVVLIYMIVPMFLIPLVILALDSDSGTLFATVIVKEQAPDVTIIARVNQAENVERIHHAGADFALSISQVSGQILAHRLLRQEAIAIDPQLRVLKSDAGRLAGRHPKSLDIRKRTGCSVVAVERGDDLVVEIGPDFHFQADDLVYVCGTNSATLKFTEEYG